jgi:hypothetical protein
VALGDTGAGDDPGRHPPAPTPGVAGRPREPSPGQRRAESSEESAAATTSRHVPAALLALREAFKKAGMRTQERQLTYAVKHTERLQAWDPSIFGRPFE